MDDAFAAHRPSVVVNFAAESHNTGPCSTPALVRTDIVGTHALLDAARTAADHLVRAYGETFGLLSTISNWANNYGPYQYPEKGIPLCTTNAMDNHDDRDSAH